MYKEIEENVKSCKCCAIVAKAPTVNFTSWPKMNWSRLHTYFPCQVKGQYHLIVVDSFLKQLKIMKYKTPMFIGTIRFSHELFTKFSIPNTIVSDNGTQFTTKKFKDFCKTFLIVHT